MPNDLIKSLVFVLQDDGGIGTNIFHFAQDEGYDSAILRIEEWRNAVEDMLDATTDPAHPITVCLLHLRQMLNLHLFNLMLQKGA